jgi:hypothetical protein
MLNRSKLLASALLMAVFAAGAAVGAAVFAPRPPQADVPAQTADSTHAARRERSREHSYIGWLEAELALAPAQRDTVERILDGYQGAMQEIWTEVRPRMDSIRLKIRGEIMAVLDSTQQERYRMLAARSDSTRRADRDRDTSRNGRREGPRDK